MTGLEAIRAMMGKVDRSLNVSVNRTFTSVSELRRWLENKNFECGSPEAFSEWLYNYFEVEGNTITVHGEEYDRWACWELV